MEKVEKFLTVLLVFVPVTIVARLFEIPSLWIFLFSSIAIIPLAKFMSEATDALATHTNASVGGLLNATFGNATEIIISIFAIQAGLIEVVKASITGSIIGNLLLVLGASLFAGGVIHKEQKFSAIGAQASTTMLTLAAIALIMPAIFMQTSPEAGEYVIRELSVLVSVLMIIAYFAFLFFVLVTHKQIYTGEIGHYEVSWGIKKSTTILIAATVGVAIMSEMLVSSIESVAEKLGWTHMFIGVIFVAVIGNVAEHSSAVLMAIKNKTELAVQIAIGSTIQIAMFVAPVLVLLSFALGNPMDLTFSTFELSAIFLSVLIGSNVVNDGKSNWVEGFLLLVTYCIMGVAFFFHP